MNRYRGDPMPSPFWREHTAKLWFLADCGLTTSETARKLGVTKNAVIGRGRRVGVTWARTRKMGSTRKPAPEFPRAGHCVYPHGHPGHPDFHFCGERVVEVGKPYCHEHSLICYRPQARQEAA